nr:Uncharacterised protein [Raoultella sp. NCTC 9187]
MNDVNRLRILQDVIDRRLPRVLQQPDLRSLTGTAAGYSSAVVNTDRYRWLTVDVVSLVTDS